ncbi:MAG: phosphoribosylglycinamide formyltransferase [Pseudomonadota bacterium]|nr:phosphoribosylglycinamide formyltransferase [Pseudomonadota bacterium]
MIKNKSIRVAVLVSGNGTNLQEIIDSTTTGKININIVAVISENPSAYALTRAKKSGISTHLIDFHKFKTRKIFDEELEKLLITLNLELIVLAGYMRILAESTVNNFIGKIINIHPSLLPAFPGLNTYERVIQSKDRWHGTSVHFVTVELDGGPSFLQYRIKIGPNDTASKLKARVQKGEYEIYPLAIEWFADKRVYFSKGRAFFDGNHLQKPIVIDEKC